MSADDHSLDDMLVATAPAAREEARSFASAHFILFCPFARFARSLTAPLPPRAG